MKRSFLRLLFLLAGSVIGFAAPSPSSASEAAQKEEKTACLACHSLRLIHYQRLSAAAWGKELDKMIGWGAVVPDRQLLTEYLAAEYSNLKPMPTPQMSQDGARR